MTAGLLELFAKLKFRVTTRDASGNKELGVLVDGRAHKTLLISGSEWTLGIAPPGTPAFVFMRDTYEVLRQASATGDGGFTSGGKKYKLKANDGETPHIAELAPG